MQHSFRVRLRLPRFGADYGDYRQERQYKRDMGHSTAHTNEPIPMLRAMLQSGSLPGRRAFRHSRVRDSIAVR
jgi:hypothetical protein